MTDSAVSVMRGRRWPAQKDRFIEADRMYEESLQAPCRGICARCGETFDGTFRTEKAWFAKHDCANA